MLILIAALSLSLDLGSVTSRNAAQSSTASCGIRTVSYKFVGAAGQEFRYGRETYRIPASGSIELVASRAATYEISGRKQPLDVWPIDDFGSRTVPLPSIQ